MPAPRWPHLQQGSGTLSDIGLPLNAVSAYQFGSFQNIFSGGIFSPMFARLSFGEFRWTDRLERGCNAWSSRRGVTAITPAGIVVLDKVRYGEHKGY